MTYALPAPGARFRSASRRLTLLVAAGAVALTALAAGSRPARAGDAEDILRFLAGAVIIGAIVNAVNDNHDPQYISRWELPGSCLETVRVRGRNIQVYNARCLRRAGYSGLPNRCSREFRINGHRRHGYVAECLYDAGYSRRGGGHYDSPPPYYNDNEPPYFDVPGMRPPFGLPISPPLTRGPSPRYDNVLPSSCSVRYRDNGRRRTGYWGGCLRDHGFTNLPRSCRRRTGQGESIYNRRCLRDAGYRVRRH